MKNFAIAVALVAALTAATLSTAEAQGKNHRDGAHRQGHASMQHRANPRKFQHALDRRQARQRARIRNGRHTGTLNRKELARLRHGQKRIRRMERRLGADGHYTRYERRYLKGAIKRLSKQIWRLKHNYRTGRHGIRKHQRFQQHFRHP